MTTRKLPDALPMQTRASVVGREAVDAEARTVTLVWTTGATVRRHRWEGWDTVVPFDESLVVTPAAVDLSRMNGGAPVLDSHSTWTTYSQVAVVERAWIEDGEGWAAIRFPAAGIDDAADRLFGLVSERIVKNISVGYTINKLRIIEPERKGEIEQHIVERWTPHEISFVTVPADPKAQVRSADIGAIYPLTIDRKESALADAPDIVEPSADELSNSTEQEARVVDTVIETRASEPVAVDRADPKADDSKSARDATIAERKRVAEIRKLGKEASEIDLADAAIDNGDSVDAFRSALLEALMKREAPGIKSDVKVGTEHHEKRMALIGDALLARAGGKPANEEGAREYRGFTLLDMAREALEVRGEKTRGMSREEIAGRALAQRSGYGSTSDFPILLGNVVNTTLRAAYEAAPQTFRPLVRETTVSDFKAVNRAQLSEGPAFDRVNEHGEYKRGSVTEGKESYKIATYGKIIAVTRQVIINDDMNAFGRIPQLFGGAAAQLESDLVWYQILSNPKMGDNVDLFHASHKNFPTAAAFAVDKLAIAKALFAKQTGVDGKTVLNIRPSYLIVPVDLETKAEQELKLLVGVTDTSKAATASMRSLEIISEARIDNGINNPAVGATVAGSSTAWYLAAAPSTVDVVELAYLEGHRGVFTESRYGFDVDGVEFKARLDVGAKVMDWRGLLKNAGA